MDTRDRRTMTKEERAREIEFDEARDQCKRCKNDCKCKNVKLPCVGFINKNGHGMNYGN